MATNRIKGLTVEIGGDTTKLGKALESIDKKSRDLSSELGEINKMLKFDPGNADLLAQKQKVLAEAVENTAKRLKTLKKAEEQVQEQFKRGEVSEDQVRALQREIMDTERKLGTYEKAAKETANAIDKLGDESDDTKENTKDVEKAADKAGKELDDFADKAKKADKASGKLGDTLKSGLKTGLIGIAAAAGAAAAGMGKSSVDAAAYADEVLTMSSVTGIATDDLQAFKYASELVDVDLETLTKSMSKNIKSMKSASDGSAAYADAYAQLGVSVTDANGNLRDGEAVYWEAIDALGKMENETERDALAMQLFGKSAQELNPLIEAGAGKMKELTQEARDVGAVLSEDALNAFGAFDDSIQRLKGSAGATKNALGGVLLPELQKLTDTGTDFLNEFTNKLNASGGGLSGFISTIDEMSDDIGAMVSDLISELLTAISDFAPTLAKVGVSLISNLATSIISALPQLVSTGLDIILSLIDGVISAIPDLVNSIVSAIPLVVERLNAAFPQIVNGIVLLVNTLIEHLDEILKPLIASLPSTIKTVVDSLIDSLPTVIDGIITLVMTLVQNIGPIIQAILPMIPYIIERLLESVAENLPTILNAIIDLVILIVTDVLPVVIGEIIKCIPQILGAILRGLGKIAGSIGSWFLSLIGKIGGWFGDIIKKAAQWVGNMGKKAKEAGSKFLSNIVSFFTQLPGKIWSFLSNAFSKVATWVSNLATKAREAGSKFITNVVNFFSQLPGKIWSWLSNAASKVASWGSSLVAKGKAAVQKLVTAVVNKVKELPNKMKEAGKNLVQGLWKGISNSYTWIKNKIKEWVGNVTDFLKKCFGIASPSKETTWMGEMLSEGLAVGIEDAENTPLKAMRRLSEGMLDEADNLNGVTLERRLNHTFSAPNVSNIETGMLDKLDKILVAIERGQILTIDGKTLIGSTVGGYDAAMGQRRALAARGAL